MRLGTAAVNNYQPDIEQYSALLFIEKTGFIGTIQSAELARQYDVGVVNAKGYSTLAARDLVEDIQSTAEKADRTIPMYAITDLDVAGLGIASDAKRTDNLSPVDALEVERIGVTLDDVEAYELEDEPVSWSKTNRKQLDNKHESGAVSDAVYEFLTGDGGRRVEINALDPVQFTHYLEAKFETLGIEKVHPDESAVTTHEADDSTISKTVDQTHEEGVNGGVRDSFEAAQTELFEAIKDHEAIPDAQTLREQYDDADISIGDDANETVHAEIVERLEDYPPKSWKDINEEIVDEHEATAEELREGLS